MPRFGSISPIGITSFIVAASDTSSSFLNSATYFCDGTNDETEIAAALTALPSVGGRVILLPGTYNIQTSNLTLDATDEIEFIPGAILNLSVSRTFTINGSIISKSHQIFSGSGTVTFNVGVMNEIYPEWWGIDGTADNVQIQAAIDAAGGGTGNGKVILSSKTYAIAATITIVSNDSLILQGSGWGVTGGTILRWTGAAGSPILRLTDCYSCFISDIRFRGHATNTPTCAISMNRSTGGTNRFNNFKNIWIGCYENLDGDDGYHFTDGIRFEGVDANNSENNFENIRINKINQYAVNITKIQFANNTFNKMDISFATLAAFRNASTMQVNNSYVDNSGVIFLHLATDDGSTAASPVSLIHDVSSEICWKLCQMNGTGRFFQDGGSFQVTTQIDNTPSGFDGATDGYLIDCANNYHQSVELTNFRWSTNGSPVATPRIYMVSASGGASYKSLIYNNIQEDTPITKTIQSNGMGATGSSELRDIHINNVFSPNGQLYLSNRQILTGGSGDSGSPAETYNNTIYDIQSDRLRIGERSTTDTGRTGNHSGTWNIQNSTTSVDTTSGTTVDATNLIPANSLVFGVTIFVRTLIVGPAAIHIGSTSDADKWGASIALTLATSTNVGSFTVTVPYITTSAETVRITSSNGAAFTAGAVRITAHYIQLLPPAY